MNKLMNELLCASDSLATYGAIQMCSDICAKQGFTNFG